MTFTTGKYHDLNELNSAASVIEQYGDLHDLIEHLFSLENKHIKLRDYNCINLIAAEAPTSPLVRKCLSSPLGYRASGGHIGRKQRCFSGMQYVDKIEAICIELLKKIFAAQYADHRLMGGLAACNVVYSALLKPGDSMMTLTQSCGGDSSNLSNGPPGLRGVKIHSIPYDKKNFRIDLEKFFHKAAKIKPNLVSIGETLTLFEHPIDVIADFCADWGGKLYFDAAHQAGLIAGGVYKNPLQQGAAIITGSGGKTFSGPQSGIIAWNDDALTDKITKTIFPVLTGSHQINRVLALSVACCEMLKFAEAYMLSMQRNALQLAKTLSELGLQIPSSHLGYTKTHQILLDATDLGGGYQACEKLQQANIMVNKMLLASDSDTEQAVPHGIRLGVAEVTRYGMGESEMADIAKLIHKALHANTTQDLNRVKTEVAVLRNSFKTLQYCFKDFTSAAPK